jgi:hypothetical protein
MRIWSRIEPGIHSIDVHDFAPQVTRHDDTVVIKQDTFNPFESLTVYLNEDQARSLLLKLQEVLHESPL